MFFCFFFFFKQKTAYEMSIGDWSSDVCSSDLIVDNNPDGMKARILRQGQPLHHKMHGIAEHEYQKAKQEHAPSGTQLSAVMKDLAQAHRPPAPQYASRGIACSLVIYTQSGGCVFRSGRRCLPPAYLPSH